MTRVSDLPEYRNAMLMLQQKGVEGAFPEPEERAGDVGYSDQQLLDWGYVYWRELPDGALYGVLSLSFGKGRICKDLCEDGYTDYWSFDNALDAAVALRDWTQSTQIEPEGWTMHHPSNRRRIKGDPSTEHIHT